jgi:hypothetical protein
VAIPQTGDSGDKKELAVVPGVPTIEIGTGDKSAAATNECSQQVTETVPGVPAVPGTNNQSGSFLLRWLKADVAVSSTPTAETAGMLPTTAKAILNDAGVRIMILDGKYILGVWRDAYTSEVRAAVESLLMGHMPVRFLEDPDIPLRYKVRHGVVPPPKAMTWSEWQAKALNDLFLEQGATGRRGNITAATVEHGERQGKTAITRRTGGRTKPAA